MPTTEADQAWSAALQRITEGPYLFQFFRCPQCAAGWVQDTDGEIRRRRPGRS
ncbi:MAG: hypothetical protein ACXVKA_16780 [Acidimicrobiia bacterium]